MTILKWGLNPLKRSLCCLHFNMMTFARVLLYDLSCKNKSRAIKGQEVKAGSKDVETICIPRGPALLHPPPNPLQSTLLTQAVTMATRAPQPCPFPFLQPAEHRGQWVWCLGMCSAWFLSIQPSFRVSVGGLSPRGDAPMLGNVHCGSSSGLCMQQSRAVEDPMIKKIIN